MSDEHANASGEQENHDPLTIEARWETPLIATHEGEATLLVRVSASRRQPATQEAPLDVAFIDLAQHAGQLRQRGIATTTIGVGQHFDEGLLSAMAEAGAGNFQCAPDAVAMRDFFTNELQELRNVAVTALTVTIALPPGAWAELISAFPAQARGGALDVAIGDVIAGDAIDLIFALRIDRDAVGSRLPVGVIAAWTDPHMDARRTRDVSLEPLRRVGPVELKAAQRDPLVAEQAALQRTAAERRAGLVLDRQSHVAESRARMRRAFDLLRAAPQTDLVAEEMDKLSQAPASSASDSHERKAAQYGEALRRRGRRPRAADGEPG